MKNALIGTMSRTLTYTIVALAALCLACDAPRHLELRLLEGTYVLRSEDDRPLPVVENVIGQLRLTLLADTLRADGRGHYTESIATEMDSIGNAFRLTDDTRHSGEYDVQNDEVLFVVRCPLGYFCLHPIGRFEDASFLRRYAEAKGKVARFERVR